MQPVRTPIQSHSEPILTRGLSVAGAVAAMVALLEASGVDVAANMETAIVGVISLIGIPVVTWYLARKKTVTVGAANAAIQRAHATDPNVADVQVFTEG